MSTPNPDSDPAPTPDSEKMARRRKINTRVLLAFGAVILLVLGFAVFGGGSSDEPVAESSPTEPAIAADSAPGAPQPPDMVRNAFSDPGEGGDHAVINFDISDSYSADSTIRVAQRDTVEILQWARDAYPDAADVNVRGHAPMTDQYGNTETKVVVNATYERATLDKINFDGVNPARIWDIRDSGMVHPEFR